MHIEVERWDGEVDGDGGDGEAEDGEAGDLGRAEDLGAGYLHGLGRAGYSDGASSLLGSG